jgi:amino acid adenylation domain-containing protein
MDPERVHVVIAHKELRPDFPYAGSVENLERSREVLMPRGTGSWWPLSERQVALIRSAEVDDDLPNRYVESELTCRLPLDGQRLAAALRYTIMRHPVLRSYFDFRPGTPLRQVVRDWAAEVPDVVDLRTTPVESRSHALADVLRELSLRPFDTGAGPLFRLAACQLGDEEYRLITVSHPALLDRWSLRAFHIELLAKYRELGRAIGPGTAVMSAAHGLMFTGGTAVSGIPANAPDGSAAALVAACASSFADFTPSRPEFWCTEPEDGAADRSAVKVPTRPLMLWIPVREGLARDLAGLAARIGVSFADVLLAAHAKAVGAATGRVAVAVGVETECWDRGAPRPLGMMTNVLATRIDLAAGTWADLIHRTAAAASAVLRLRDVSYLRIQRILGTSQLLDSSFCYSESGLESDLLDRDAGMLAGLSGYQHSRPDHGGILGRVSVPVEGTVLVEAFRGAGTGHLALRLTAGRDLTVTQLREVARLHIEILTRCTAASEPHRKYSPLTPFQKRLVLSRWNRPVYRARAVDRPDRLGSCVHELFERQVRRAPSAIAVTDASRTLTYRELNVLANRLGHRLRSEGIGPGSVVGVSVRRDATLLVSFLAALKAGAAYLPLDPRQPAERVDYMLRDAGVSLVLSDDTYGDSVPAGKWSVINTADSTGAAGTYPDSDLGPASTPADLMYVIYTSGSTGKPKGVEVPHSSVSNYLWWCAEAYAGKGEGGAALFSSTAFDMVVPILYTPLITGQRVCLIDETLDMLEIAEQLANLAPFSFVKMTPAQLRILIGLLTAEDIGTLAGMFVVGGEAFAVSTLRQLRRADPETPVLNEYGPTEASVGNCVYFADGTEDDGLLPIGRPIPRTTIYVLDATMAPVPVGVPGEIYIGGACLARGYAGRPVLTAERFIADPFGPQPGARLYRTGDIGRWLPSGVLTFLGRADGQLKVRGYRVEPAEVETVLIEHPSVSAAVVSGVGAFPDPLSLAAYYVGAPDLTPAEVRAYLVRRLPEYMVPNFLISVPWIPVNANGKTDHKALPRPGWHRPDHREEMALAGELGSMLAKIWTDVFAIDQVSSGPRVVSDPVAPPATSDLFREAQLALRIAQLMGISAGRAFGLVTNVKTVAELCDRVAREAYPGSASSSAVP